MTSINKQKFLTELGKLLTFMFEDDRLRALELYNRMFEETEDERALLQFFVSPTKQAVIVARAYNANLGRLSVNPKRKAPAEDKDADGVPDYIQAIEAVREAAIASQMLVLPAQKTEEPEAEAESEPVDENQMTLFDEDVEEDVSQAAEEAEGEEPDSPSEGEENEAAAPAEAELPQTDAPLEDGEPQEEAAETAEAENAAEENASAPEAEPSPEPLTEAVGKLSQKEKIEYFNMNAEDDELATVPLSAAQREELFYNIDTAAMKKTRRRPKVFLLFLYILLAIPVTLAAIVLLLVPALLFLALSIGSIICGVVVVSAAFHGFAVFADIMVVLGLALILFALGLLFLWTAIWFVGGVIVALVHGVAALCDKWCYEEVSEG